MSYRWFTRMKPSDFDYLKVIGKGSFGKVRISFSYVCFVSFFPNI